MGTYFYYKTSDKDLIHYGVLGMKWGVRRYQNADGSLTSEGLKRYGTKTQRNIRSAIGGVVGTLALGPVGGIAGSLIGKLGSKDTFNKAVTIGSAIVATQLAAIGGMEVAQLLNKQQEEKLNNTINEKNNEINEWIDRYSQKKPTEEQAKSLYSKSLIDKVWDADNKLFKNEQELIIAKGNLEDGTKYAKQAEDNIKNADKYKQEVFNKQIDNLLKEYNTKMAYSDNYTITKDRYLNGTKNIINGESELQKIRKAEQFASERTDWYIKQNKMDLEQNIKRRDKAQEKVNNLENEINLNKNVIDNNISILEKTYDGNLNERLKYTGEYVRNKFKEE